MHVELTLIPVDAAGSAWRYTFRMHQLAALTLFSAAMLILPACQAGHQSKVYHNKGQCLDTEPLAVANVLDDFHDAASKADESRYFGHFAWGGVFIGTDASERWTVEQFRAYAHPYFSQGKGWTYRSTSREIDFSGDQKTAWFDEMLVNEKWGVCRGSGVLVRWSSGGAWKIAQYNLSVPIPNDLLPGVAEQIKAFEAGKH